MIIMTHQNYNDKTSEVQNLKSLAGSIAHEVRNPLSAIKGCCEIGLKIDGEWLWRSNVAGETQVEGEKGQGSDSFKRAAVLWGVGRYLYYLPTVWSPLKNGKITQTPNLPKWAYPKGS